MRIFKEISCLPPVSFFQGIIGGHCVIPNIEILSAIDHSEMLKAIQSSNSQKIAREAGRG